MLYGIYMLYHGITAGLGGNAGTTKVVVLILAVIPTLMILSAVMCASAVKTGSQQWINQSEHMMKQMEKQNPEMQKALKELEAMGKQFEQTEKEE